MTFTVLSGAPDLEQLSDAATLRLHQAYRTKTQRCYAEQFRTFIAFVLHMQINVYLVDTDGRQIACGPIYRKIRLSVKILLMLSRYSNKCLTMFGLEVIFNACIYIQCMNTVTSYIHLLS